MVDAVTDPAREIFYRRAGFRSQDAGQLADDGSLEILASTDEPCDMGGWTETLVHDADAVDTSACRALLVNHNPGMIGGTLADLSAGEGRMVCKAKLLPGARLESGVTVADAVKAGALRGVSIGYTYNRADCLVDEQARSVRVLKWRALEVSLTPIPADAAAGVRSFPAPTRAPAAHQTEEQTMTDPVTKPQATPVAENVEAARAAAFAEQGQIAKLARSHDLSPEDYVGQPLAKAIDQMLVDKAKRSATEPTQTQVVVTRDAGDKAHDVATASLLDLHGIRGKDDKLVERGYGILEIARRHAIRMGLAGAADWCKADVASYILGKPCPGSRNAPNVTQAFFSTYVLANAMDKAVLNGFANFGSQTTWRKWCSRKTVSSFKQFTVGGLDMGNLESVAEGQALPELVKSDGGYNGTLGLYGATVSLSYQALISDDLGEFMRLVERAGAIAERTIEELVYAAVSGGTWTNNTTASTALSTASNLDLVREGFESKSGPAGEKLGNVPRFLLVPSALRGYALAATKQTQGATTVVSNADIEPIITPYLPTVTTKANSKYYLAGDPALVDTVTVAELQGAESPQVMEYDAGAAAARSWKIIKPVVAVLATMTIGGTIYKPGMQQGGA
jgi:hypothetical protein